ncbi:MAG TPA: phage holin family protein [Jiangellaceae bacterium]
MAEGSRQQTAQASTGELVVRLTDDIRTLVRDEIRLAQLELKKKAKRAGIGSGLFGVASVVALFGVATLIACAVLALGLALPYWASALIVGVVLLLAAGLLALVGKRQLDKALPPRPDEAIEGVKKDIDAVAGGVRR